MYKIHSKLVFFFKKNVKKINILKNKINTLKKKRKCPRSASEQCKKKQGILAFQLQRFQRRKEVGPSEQYAFFFFNQTAATTF